MCYYYYYYYYFFCIIIIIIISINEKIYVAKCQVSKPAGTQWVQWSSW